MPRSVEKVPVRNEKRCSIYTLTSVPAVHDCHHRVPPSVLTHLLSLPPQYTGGDGSVSWSSNNSQLASVSQQGVLRTRGRGHSTVTVSLVRNPRIKAHAQVRTTCSGPATGGTAPSPSTWSGTRASRHTPRYVHTYYAGQRCRRRRELVWASGTVPAQGSSYG